jgi:hypothetical protein
MTEVWLRPNSRALLLGTIPSALVAAVGLLLGLGVLGTEAWWARGIGWCLLSVSVLAIGVSAWFWRQPRLAYRDGELLVFLRAGAPVRLPVELAECMLMGRGPSPLPGPRHKQAKTLNLVIRLSESAPQWANLPVKPALGEWSDGYVTLRGTWCEPLTIELVQRLNERLAEAHRQTSRTEVVG